VSWLIDDLPGGLDGGDAEQWINGWLGD